MAKKYIDADLLVRKIKGQIRLENLNFAALGGGGQTFCTNTLEWVLKQIDSLQQEQPSEDLEEEIKRYIPRDQCPVPDFMEAVARHFAEWQKEQMLRIVKNRYELSMTFVTGNSEVDQAIQMDRLTLVKIIEEGKR